MNYPEFISYFKKINREVGSYQYSGNQKPHMEEFAAFIQKRLSEQQDYQGLPYYAQYLSTMQQLRVDVPELQSIFNRVVQTAFSEQELASEIVDLSFKDLVEIMWAQDPKM